jgi:hypothetical protein
VTKLLSALVVQGVILGIIFYIDARQTVSPAWQTVLSFGLNPLTILFYGLTPIAVWWSYRVVYAFVDERFWLAALVQGLFIRIVYIGTSYLGSGQVPTRGETVALFLGIASVIVARF